MRLFLLSDNHDTLAGMRLVGIRGYVINESSEAEKILDSLLKDKEIGIILVTEKLAEDIRTRINEIKQKMASPLIVEIPDRHGSIKDQNYITDYIRDSIGIKI